MGDVLPAVSEQAAEGPHSAHPAGRSPTLSCHVLKHTVPIETSTCTYKVFTIEYIVIVNTGTITHIRGKVATG